MYAVLCYFLSFVLCDFVCTSFVEIYIFFCNIVDFSVLLCAKLPQNGSKLVM